MVEYLLTPAVRAYRIIRMTGAWIHVHGVSAIVFGPLVFIAEYVPESAFLFAIRSIGQTMSLGFDGWPEWIEMY